MLTKAHAALPASSRLRADVALYSSATGHVLRVGDLLHDVHLDDAAACDLIDALVEGGVPADDRARSALVALAEHGLVDPEPRRLEVVGEGNLASALRAALGRMGAHVGPGGDSVVAADDDALPDGVPPGTVACWVAGPRVVLAPANVPAADVVARYRAATRHAESALPSARASASRGVRSAHPLLSGAGLELAAVQVAAELLRADRVPYEAVAIDLLNLTISRHPVLPLPTAPR